MNPPQGMAEGSRKVSRKKEGAKVGRWVIGPCLRSGIFQKDGRNGLKSVVEYGAGIGV